MSQYKILSIIGFFLVNGILIGSLFTGIHYVPKLLLLTVILNLVYIAFLMMNSKKTKHT